MEQWERGIISWSSRAGDAREVAGGLASRFIGSARSGCAYHVRRGGVGAVQHPDFGRGWLLVDRVARR